MRDTLNLQVLYRDRAASVTPVWLRVKNASYPIHTIKGIDYQQQKEPRLRSMALFFIALILLFFSIAHALREALPLPVALILILLSGGIWLVSGWLFFFKADRCRLQIDLNDGRQLTVLRRDPGAVKDLYSAILQAMSLQHQPVYSLSDRIEQVAQRHNEDVAIESSSGTAEHNSRIQRRRTDLSILARLVEARRSRRQ